MNYLDQYNILVGETLMSCQRIEHDIKIIYAAMLDGDIKSNLSLVRRETLGSVLVALKALDNSDNAPMFSENDYALLKDIKNIRNYIAHQCYIDFLYQNEEDFSAVFSKSSQKMSVYNENLKKLAVFVEKARFTVLSRFKFI